MRDESSANPDVELLAAVRPGLSSIPGSMLLIASSPYAKRGALYLVVVERAYEDDPARASAEYGAQFRDVVAAFVTREVGEGCTALGRYELPPISGTVYGAFVGPSGGSSDSMTLAIAHRAGKLAVLD